MQPYYRHRMCLAAMVLPLRSSACSEKMSGRSCLYTRPGAGQEAGVRKEAACPHPSWPAVSGDTPSPTHTVQQLSPLLPQINISHCLWLHWSAWGQATALITAMCILHKVHLWQLWRGMMSLAVRCQYLTMWRYKYPGQVVPAPTQLSCIGQLLWKQETK